jgi:methionyl-tRNA formyltransferase
MEVPPPPWRVVILSMVPPAVHGIVQGLKALGHDPVALVTPRPRHERAARERFRELVDGAPAELDVVVVPSKDRLPRILRAYEPDLCVCLGYPWLLQKEVLEIPRIGILNSHPSILPKYRGPFPFAWAIRNGDTEIGQTLHLMDERFDTGPILAQRTLPIGEDEYLTDFLPRFGESSSQLFVEALTRLARGDRGDPQSDEGASWAGEFEEEYVYVDWSKGRREIHKQVRAWAMAFTRNGPRGAIAEVEGEQVRILRASLEPVDGAREVQAGDGPIWIVETEPVE